jgi:hypothetical protein
VRSSDAGVDPERHLAPILMDDREIESAGRTTRCTPCCRLRAALRGDERLGPHARHPDAHGVLMIEATTA